MNLEGFHHPAVAFSWENIEALETQDIDYDKLSIRLKKLIVLTIVHLCVKRFATKQNPASDIDISSEIKIPLKIVKVLLNQLMKCKILLEVNDPSHIGYVPAHDIECLSILDVLDAFEQRGDNIITIGGTIEFEALEESLNAFGDACQVSSGQRNLKDI
jgi:membrane protein